MEYTGVRVIEVKQEVLAEIQQNQQLSILFDQRYKFYQNEYVVLKDATKEWPSCISRCRGDFLVPLKEKYKLKAVSLEARNKEQHMALDALLDDSIRLVVLTGLAGSGKSLTAMAAAMQKIEDDKYERIVITKNMVSVGKELGYLKGDMEEKFLPYNQGTLSALDFLTGHKKNKSSEDISRFYNIEYMPTAVIRGSSFNNTILIVDEVQNCSSHELLTIGTRVSENTKIIVLGDLDQIDIKGSYKNSGLYKLVNNPLFKESKISAYIHLIKSERGEVAELFSNIFKKED